MELKAAPPGSPYHRFNPEIPETELDRSTIALLGSISTGEMPELIFGRDDCSTGTIFIPQLGCCWHFEAGAVRTIERLSQGTSNVWKVAWTCDGEDLDHPPMIVERHSEDGQRLPWRVNLPDGGLFVFPLGVDLSIYAAGLVNRIPAGAMLGRLLFHPKGRKSFVPGHRSYAVALAFTGFDLLASCMDIAVARGLRTPDYIVADVPESRLRLFSDRFGFRPFGQFGIMTSVIAPIETVRQHAFDNRERGIRLSERARRESN